MTSDLDTLVLLSCSLYLWLSHQHSVLRLAQKDAETSKHVTFIPEKKPFFSAARDAWLERKDRNTHKFLKTEANVQPLEMHLINQKNTHTSF